ncbi:hypothetical protein LCGC14_1402610 [marine sediment metagenome]|uniref:Uncharacterized protein n=1 Tax=marine sediment metagenome TaxID=412755 RepID=A0A0F9JWL7_9ZZZZ
MVFKKKSLTELKKEIAEQKRKISGEDISSKELSERSKLNKELFELRNRKLIKAGEKAKRLSKRFGRGILKAGQKATPLIKKQIKLIRDQQLRDEAIERKLSKRKKPKKQKKSKGFNVFDNLDF